MQHEVAHILFIELSIKPILQAVTTRHTSMAMALFRFTISVFEYMNMGFVACMANERVSISHNRPCLAQTNNTREHDHTRVSVGSTHINLGLNFRLLLVLLFLHLCPFRVC